MTWWDILRIEYYRKDINYNSDKLREGESRKLNWRGTKWIQKRNGKLEWCDIQKGRRPICKRQKTKH